MSQIFEEADDLNVSNNFTFTEGDIDVPNRVAHTYGDLKNEERSSTSSSPFITNPEMITINDKGSDQVLGSNDNFSRSNLSINMDESIVSLRESLNNLKVTQPNANTSVMKQPRNEDYRNLDKSITVNSDMSGFNFTNHFNETKYLNDLKLRNASGIQKQPKPWQNFRTSTRGNSHSQMGKNYLGHKSVIFGNSSPIKNGFPTQEASSSLSKIDDLNKEITGYKIQIKFFKQFLQKLMDQNPENQQHPILNFDDINALSNIDNISDLEGNQNINKLKINYDNLLQEYNEVFVLNEDLYKNLEEFQGNLEDMDMKLKNLHNYVSNCTGITNEILYLLANDEITEEHSSIALKKCLDDSSKGLDIKLLAIKLEIGKNLEQNRAKFEDKGNVSKYIGLTKELISSFEDIVNEFTSYKNESTKIEVDLIKDEKETRELQIDFQNMNLKFNELYYQIQNSNPPPKDQPRESRRDNSNFNLRAIDNELRSLEDNRASPSIPDSKSTDQTKYNYSNSISGELLQSHKDFNDLNEEFNRLSEKYRSLENNSSKAISSLTTQLQEKQRDVNDIHAEKRVNDTLKQDLDIAVEKQRILKAEKIRLVYSLESLTKEKVSMQSTIKSLTDKITSLTIDNSHDASGDAFRKQLSTLEYRIEDLLLYDIHKFQKFLKSFNKIADDRSLKEPNRKVEFLLKRVTEASDKVHFLNLDDYNMVKDYHKSVTDYFTRAVDILVNDHVKSLLRESDAASQNNSYVAKLHNRIDDLNKHNESLSKEVESIEERSDTTSTSPRSKLRIEELSNRWKAEREARVYENKEAQKRLRELELENARLRSNLNI